jgi:integrase
MRKPNLTNFYDCSYHLGTENNSFWFDMRVKIKTRQVCPVCGEKFVNLSCLKHSKVKPSIYYLYWNYQGIEFKLYGFDSLKSAVAKAGAIENEIETFTFKPEFYKSSSGKVTRRYQFALLIDKWIDRRKKDAAKDIISPAYLTKNIQAVEKFKTFFNNQDVRLIRKDTIRDFLYSLDCGQKTQKNLLTILRVFFAELAEDNIIHSVPSFPKIKHQKPSVKWTDEETQAKIVSEIPMHHRPIILFLMATGCRPQEARALQWEDIDFKNESITIRHAFSGSVFRQITKGKRERQIPIMPEVREILQPRGITGFVFNVKGQPYKENRIGKVWRRARAKVGLSDLTLYGGTRHSKASQLANSGISLWLIGELLGHSEKKTTEKYAHGNLDALRVALSDKKRKVK